MSGYHALGLTSCVDVHRGWEVEAAEKGNQTKKLQDLLGEANCHRTTAGSNRAGYSSGSDCGILRRQENVDGADGSRTACRSVSTQWIQAFLVL